MSDPLLMQLVALQNVWLRIVYVNKRFEALDTTTSLFVCADRSIAIRRLLYVTITNE
jgi:hypothetical protein